MAEAVAYLFSRDLWLESLWGWFALYPISLALAGGAVLLRRKGWINLGLLNPWVIAFTLPYVLVMLIAPHGDQVIIKSGLRFIGHLLDLNFGKAIMYLAFLLGPFQIGCALLLILNLVENFTGRLFVKPSFYVISLTVMHLLSTFLLLAMSAW